jgi:hypothetical protein
MRLLVLLSGLKESKTSKALGLSSKNFKNLESLLADEDRKCATILEIQNKNATGISWFKG